MKAKEINQDDEFVPTMGTEQKEVRKEVKLVDLPGVGPATIEKLAMAGFGDIMAVAVATPG